MLDYAQIIEFISDDSLPPMYDKWKATYIGMSLHIDGACPRFTDLRSGNIIYPKNWFGEEYQKVFDEVLINRHPREPEVSRQWRLGQYRPFQQDAFLRVISMIKGAIFQDSGYGIVIEDEEDSKYIWGENFSGNSLPGYVSDHLQYVFNDPNGYFVAIPALPGYQTSDYKVRVKVVFVPSKQILYSSEDELIFTIGEGEYKTIWVVNKIGYFRFKKDDDGNIFDLDREYGGYYAHMLDRIPAVIAGGIWNTQGFYDSWLNSAKAWADEYVSSMSASQMVNKEASHPYIIEASAPCPTCPGSNGKINVECEECPGGRDIKDCETCKGTGQISRSPGDRMIAPADQMGNDLIKIVNPEVSINDFHLKNTDKIYEAIMRSLHLNYIEAAQSGAAKDKDMETRYQFVVAISNDIFDRIILNLVKFILGIRNISVENGISRPNDTGFYIIKPIEFNIKTAQDLLFEYENANKANIPSFVLAKHIEDYVDKQYGGDEVLKKKTAFINDVDILALKSDSDKQILVMNGAASTRDWKFSLRLPKIIDQVIREKTEAWFLEASFDKIQAEVQRIFDVLVPPDPVFVDPSQFNDPGYDDTGA